MIYYMYKDKISVAKFYISSTNQFNQYTNCNYFIIIISVILIQIIKKESNKFYIF